MLLCAGCVFRLVKLQPRKSNQGGKLYCSSGKGDVSQTGAKNPTEDTELNQRTKTMYVIFCEYAYSQKIPPTQTHTLVLIGTHVAGTFNAANFRKLFVLTDQATLILIGTMSLKHLRKTPETLSCLAWGLYGITQYN